MLFMEVFDRGDEHTTVGWIASRRVEAFGGGTQSNFGSRDQIVQQEASEVCKGSLEEQAHAWYDVGCSRWQEGL